MENKKLDFNEMTKDIKARGLDLPEVTQLSELSTLVSTYEELAIMEMEVRGVLKLITDKLNSISNQYIPDMFDELGVEQLGLKDGRTVKVNRSYGAAITLKKADECYDWLEVNGHDAIVKESLAIDLKKGDKALAERVKAKLHELGIAHSYKKSVHSNTLRAFVKEQIEQGNDFPMDLFSVFPLRTTKIS